MTVRILRIQPRNSGHTRIVFDARADVRPTIIALTEAAHDLLAHSPHEWMDTLMYQAPQRGTYLT